MRATDICYGPGTSISAGQQNVRSWGRSGHCLNTANRSFLTHNVTLPPSIDAVPKDHSIKVLAGFLFSAAFCIGFGDFRNHQ